MCVGVLIKVYFKKLKCLHISYDVELKISVVELFLKMFIDRINTFEKEVFNILNVHVHAESKHNPFRITFPYDY